jgi:gamma-glutamyltranspeptidase / glutathione hydrolase
VVAGVGERVYGSVAGRVGQEESKGERRMRGRIANGGAQVLARLVARALAVVTLATGPSGCGAVDSVSDSLFASSAPAEGTPGHITGFLGSVVADEPRAALAGREVLSSGGNAMDAAVATALALTVTLPSRAGLGGGGACLVLAPSTDGPNGGAPEAVMFVAPAPAVPGTLDRPAAIPMLARGLYALQAKYGRRPFESLIKPAEQMAQFGIPASRAFLRDLNVVAGPLMADPSAATVFFRDGKPLGEGALMTQPELAATLSQLRTAGVGDLYQGTLARRLVAGAPAAGASFSLEELRAALPRVVPPLTVPGPRNDTVAFLPPPADGGLAAEAAFEVLRKNPGATEQANAKALAVATLWRKRGGDPQQILAEDDPPANLPPLPASTTFAALDREGNAVVCATTMNNLFGTGRIAPGTGILLAASPNWLPPALLSAALAWNANIHAFRAAVGGSGQEAAPLATAVALLQALGDHPGLSRGVAGGAARGQSTEEEFSQKTTSVAPTPTRSPVPEPGRANVIECDSYLPGSSASCGWATDPRGSGLAAGSN